MMRDSIEPRTRKYVRGFEFLSFARNLPNKYGNKLLDTNTKTGLYAALIFKTAEATGNDRE